ncbi:hypothetical protein Tco_1317530 [Tanacetum coccineum]
MLGDGTRLLFQRWKMLHRISSKQGRKSLTLMKIKYSLVVLEEEEPTELVEDQCSGEKGEKEVTTTANFQTYIRRRRDVSTGSGRVSTTNRQDGTADVNTASEIGSTDGEKAKDKEQYNEEETQRIARDAKITKQLQEEIDIARKKEVVTKDDEAHDIDWSDPSMIRYHALQNRPRSVAEVRKNMCIYLKNQGGYKMKDFKRMTYDDIRPILEKVWDQNHTFVAKDSEIEKEVMKRPGFDLQQDNSKRQKTGSVLVEEPKDKEPVEPSQVEIQEMMIILPEERMHIEALQIKYPLIDLEIHFEDTMKFWKIFRLGNYTEIYQTFIDMLKNFDRYDLVKLWELVKERFNTTELIDDKEKELWVKLKRLFEPDTDDLMELQSHMHDPLTWRLYDTYGVYYVSTKTGLDMFMLVEKGYPLTRVLPMLMLVNKLIVDYDSKMAASKENFHFSKQAKAVKSSSGGARTYSRKKRTRVVNTGSRKVSSASDLFSTAADEEVAKKLHDEELAKVVVEDQRKHLGAIEKYQALKRKPISVAQARKNMMIYLKNTVGYKMKNFKGMSYEDIRPIFEKEYNRMQTLFKKGPEVEKQKTKRVTEETLLPESFKKLKTVEASSSKPILEQQDEEPEDLSEEEIKKMMMIVPVEEFIMDPL